MEVAVNLGQWLAIGISVLLGVNYMVGMMVNRRKSTALFHWLREGTQRAIGAVSEARWIGSASSGARLTVAQARAPFRRVEMIYLMATRELLPLFWLQRLRNRRDELIVKALLRTPPGLEWELAHPRDERTQHRLEAEGFRAGPDLEGWRLFYKGDLSPERRSQIQQMTRQLGTTLRGFSLRRKQPHLIVRLALPTDVSTSAEAIFRALSEGLRF